MNKIELENLDKNYYFYIGYESIIYLYNNGLLKYFRDKEIENNIEQIYKKNHDYDFYNMLRGKTNSEEDMKKKEKKVYMIPFLKCLENEVQIYDRAYKDGIFKGYTMEKSYYKPIDVFEKKRCKIEYLKMIKKKIEYLNSCGVFIGDFNRKNFLTNTNKNDIKLCDLDNFRIYSFDFDTKNPNMKRFEYCCKNKELIDSYCFNIFTICYLSKICSSYFNFNNKLPYILDTKENREIYDSMNHLDNSYQKKYLIDNLR